MTRLRHLAAAAALATALAAPAPAADDEARARQLLNALGCKGCHTIEGVGGTLGPALDGVGKRLKQAQIEQKLRDPKAGHPASLMPSFSHLPEQDIQSLAAFLSRLR